jgi:hypothetical protein
MTKGLNLTVQYNESKKTLHKSKEILKDLENKKLHEDVWYTAFIDLNLNINFTIINILLIGLFEEYFSKLSEDQYFYIIFRISTDYGVKSISNMQTGNKNSYSELLNVFLACWGFKEENYKDQVIGKISYSFKIIPKGNNVERVSIKKPYSKKEQKKESINYLQISSFNYPSTRDITKWGQVEYFKDGKEALVFKRGSSVQYRVKINELSLDVEVLANTRISTFKDEWLPGSNLGTFRRTLKNYILDYKDEKLILKRKKILTPKIKTIRREGFKANKYLTMDIETRKIGNNLIPFAVCMWDGVKAYSFYLLDYKNSEDMLNDSVKNLMKRKYKGYKVYFHNLSNFDGIYLVDLLSSINNNVKPKIKDNQIIELAFKFGWNYTIYFRDSLLLLPEKLKKLAVAFNVIKKGIYPVLFVNDPNTPLDYIGPIPAFKYFVDITQEEYEEYCKEFTDSNKWNLREETLKYCINDCVTLYQILDKFFESIYNLFRINVTKYPTLSSLAFAVYRSKFMKIENIPILTGKIYNFIKLSYTGGAVDVYKPHGEKVYRYDVNSLYPNEMWEEKLPIGNPIIFEGDISKILTKKEQNNIFGFYHVKVKAPDNLNEPILITRINTDSGERSIAPLGNWNDIYTTFEIEESSKYGYEFEILRGVYFEKDHIFKEYVEFFFDLKQKSEADSSQYTISKLFLNTLYGKFGMKPNLNKHTIVESDDIHKIAKNFTVLDIIQLKNGKELISYEDSVDYDSLDYKRPPNISIAIASAITACGRMHMSKFKNNPNFSLYYSDTDNIDIDRPLDPKYVGTGVGHFS